MLLSLLTAAARSTSYCSNNKAARVLCTEPVGCEWLGEVLGFFCYTVGGGEGDASTTQQDEGSE